MKTFLICLLCLFAGCDDSKILTSSQIIAETKKCQEAGMNAVFYYYVDDPRVRGIQCQPKDMR